MIAPEPYVLAINFVMEVVLLDDCETHVPITTWIDEDGDECDKEDAVVCVCGADGIGWWDLVLDDFEATEH